jgi:hypothetical protein
MHIHAARGAPVGTPAFIWCEYTPQVPEAFEPCRGVIMTKISDSRYALWKDRQNAWVTFTLQEWEKKISTPAPRYCPVGGFCIMQRIVYRRSTSKDHSYDIDVGELESALGQTQHDLGCWAASIESGRAKEAKERLENRPAES